MNRLDEKVEMHEVEAMMSNKVDKKEIAEMLPDMTMYELKFASVVEEQIEEFKL